MTPEARARAAELLLAELKDDSPRRWFYISMANSGGFVGAALIRAHGPIDAWRLLHHLGLYPPQSGAETLTIEVDDGKMQRVPEDLRWRLLTATEARDLGK